MIYRKFNQTMRLLLILYFTLICAFCYSCASNKNIDTEDKRSIICVPTSKEYTKKLYKESHALLIGVSKYQKGWHNLPSVLNEVDDVERALKDQGFNVIKVINPISKELKIAFEDFVNKYGFDFDNRLLFYFSGHGYTRNLPNGIKRGYIVPADAPDPRLDERAFISKSLDMLQIKTWAKLIESKHALFIFDSCFSGTIFETKSVLNYHPPHITENVSRPVREFITAGREDEVIPAKSIFTPLFVDALLKGYGDLNKDSYITGIELGMYLYNKVIKYNNSQTPQYGKILDTYLDDGDFVFQVYTNKKKVFPENTLHEPLPTIHKPKLMYEHNDSLKMYFPSEDDKENPNKFRDAYYAFEIPYAMFMFVLASNNNNLWFFDITKCSQRFGIESKDEFKSFEDINKYVLKLISHVKKDYPIASKHMIFSYNIVMSSINQRKKIPKELLISFIDDDIFITEKLKKYYIDFLANIDFNNKKRLDDMESVLNFLNDYRDYLISHFEQKSDIKELLDFTSKGKLYITTEPTNTAINIIGLKNKFFQGMEIENGRYEIEISANGFETEKISIVIGIEEEKKLVFILDQDVEKVDINSVKTPEGKSIKNFRISKQIKKKFQILIKMILQCKSMDNDERNYWFSVLPIMTPPQLRELKDILSDEKKEERRNKSRQLEKWNKIIKKFPENAECYYQRGNILREQKKFDKAMVDYEKAIELNPRNAGAHYSKGIILGEKGDIEQSTISFSKSLKICPRFDYACNSLAWLLSTSHISKYRNGFKAVKFAKKALELNETHFILDTMAAAYAEAGDFGNAILTQKKAIALLKSRDNGKQILADYTKRLNFYNTNKAWREK